jgi:hypothetical protein
MSLLLEDSCDLLPISLISALRKLALWLAERRQFFNADLLAKHDGRTLLYYFVEASNLSQAWQQNVIAVLPRQLRS